MHTRTAVLMAVIAAMPGAVYAQQATPAPTTPAPTTPAPTTPALAAPPTPPQASPPREPDISQVNFFDIGWRGTVYGDGSDEARYQRYRGLRNGPTADAFRWSRDTASEWFTVSADHAGYRDQRYAASLNRFGRLKASFEWNQIPLLFSDDSLSLHTSASPGVLRVDDRIQRGIETQATTLPAVTGEATPFEMRLKRSIADARVTYEATEHLDVTATFRNTFKEGSQPWAGTFGFSNAVELAVPIDTRTTELGTALEWSNARGSARLGYDGSFFHNEIDSLIWDNPLRITDSPTAGPMQGRMALWPDSAMNTGSGLGTINLPWRSRATAYVSIANWTQNEPLIPYTVNSALPEIPLDRTTADTSAVVTAMHYTLTSRPTSKVSLLARYRWYDFDNRTAQFHSTQTVAYDTSVSAFAEGGTSPYSLDRKTFDAEVSYTPVTHTALRAGYTHDGIGQTFRFVDKTTEHTARLSADLTGTAWLTVRGVYEHAMRAGTGLDEQVLDDIGEQTSLRQFDLSDRTADRLSAIVMVMPTGSLSFTGQTTVGDDDRADDSFGVVRGRVRSYSIGVDFIPRDTVAFDASYVYDKYGTLQRSRQANPGPEFDDPRRDWTTDARERADTVTAGLDLIKLWPRTDIRIGYDFSNASSRYVYGLAPDSTLAPVQQLPPVVNRVQRGTLDARYYLTSHTALGMMYWFEQYHVDDFAQGAETLDGLAQPSFLTIGYSVRPYTANTFVGRLTYFW